MPCRLRAGDQGSQVVGGDNGKMAYRLPNVKIEVGVVHTYWATRNSCTDEFMDNYNYPKAWSNCPGDGGSIGGKPQHHLSCGEEDTEYNFPEEVRHHHLLASFFFTFCHTF